MAAACTRKSIVRIVSALFLLLIALVTVPANAIQLRWSTGSTDLTIWQDTQAMLIVQADSSEGALPNSWRLQWTADSLGLQFSPFELACLVDTAKVDSVAGPATPADSAANQVTAFFCSSGGDNATTAYYLVDLPAGGHGKLKVVALDPADPDSSTVISSNEVTYNGGVEGEYAPAILRTTSTHDTRELRVTLVGSDLTGASTLRISAPDRVWNVPLAIVGSTNSILTAAADVPTPLPAAVFEAGSSGDMVSVAEYSGDAIVLSSESMPDTVLYRDPNPDVYPKDFAFYQTTVPTSDPGHPWKRLFHLIYIRHFESTEAEPSLAHAWSENLTSWRVQTDAFLPNAGWDGQFVWAPSLVQVGNLQYMFYTGVDMSGNQRIGYATTTLLDTTNTIWARQSTWTYSADSTGWADPAAPGIGKQQFRDPWVMADPDSAGRFLMFNIGQDKNYGAQVRTVVGVARNRPGTLQRWIDLGSYRDTDYGHTKVTSVESPMVIRDSSGTGAWRIYFANAWWNLPGYNSTFIATQAAGHSVSDTTAGLWAEIDSLYSYLGGNPSVLYWQACEHLQVGNAHLFAAYNGSGIAITRTYWNGSNFVIGYPDLTAVEDAPLSGSARFFVANLRPGTQSVSFIVDAPARGIPNLAVYDLAGRRLKTLMDGRELLGRREINWDCRDAHGNRVPTGMYFARLTGIGPAKVLRVPVVR